MFTSAGENAGSGLTSCYRHPHRMTALRCPQCQRPTCSDCLVPTPQGLLCPDDAAAVDMAEAPVGSFGQHEIKFPFVTWILAAINVVIYLVTAFGGENSLIDNSHSRLYHDLVLSPVLVGEDKDIWRLFTGAFLHHGLVHLVLDLVVLGLLGHELERLLGWWRFASIYLISIFGGAVTVLSVGQEATPVAVGSAATFGLFVTSLVIAKVIGLDVRSLWVTVLILFVITLTVTQTSDLGHLGGAFFGGCAVGAVVEFSLERKPPQQRKVNRQVIALTWVAGFLIVLAVLRIIDISRSAPLAG